LKIPTNRDELSIFLRDYNGRIAKTPKQKVTIAREIVNSGKAILDGKEYILTPEESNTFARLYRKYILGKFIEEVPLEKIEAIFKMDNCNIYYTIEDIAILTKTSNECIRQKLNTLVLNGKLVKGPHPDNKRRNVFSLAANYVSLN
jgi:hypothetical protein